MRRIRLKTVLIVIAFMALGMALLMQEVRSRRRMAELEGRLAQMRAEVEVARAQTRLELAIYQQQIAQARSQLNGETKPTEAASKP